MRLKLDKYILFDLSVMIMVLYAFLPVVRVLPIEIRYLMRGLPVVFYFLCLIISNRLKAIGNFFLIMLYALILIWIRSSVNNANGIGEPLVTVISSVTYWLPMAQAYYVTHYLSWDNVKRIIKRCVAIVCFSSITTLFGNIFFGSSRDLQELVRYDVSAGSSYYIRNIGTYGFVFGIAFLSISLITLLKFKNKTNNNKVFLLFTYIFAVLSIILAEYMTAMIIIIVGLISLLKKRKAMISFFTMTFVFFLTYAFVPQFYYEIGHHIALVFRNSGMEYIYERIEGISLVMSGVRVTGGDVGARFYYYQMGLDLFKSNAILGSGLLSRGTFSVGGHSDLIDYLAAGGLVGLLPFAIAIIYYYKMVTKNAKNEESMLATLVIILTFIIYGVVDHVFSNFEVGLSVFLIPSMLALFDKEKDQLSV